MQLFKQPELEPYISPTTGLKVYPVKVDIKTGLSGGKGMVFTTGDINSAIIAVALYDGVEPYVTEGKSVTANISRPDKTEMTILGTLVSKEYFEFKLGYTGVAQAGIYTLDIQCSWEGGQVTTPIFDYKVTQSLTVEDGVQEDDRFPILTELVNEVDDKVRQIDAKLSEVDGSLLEVSELVSQATNKVGELDEAIQNVTSKLPDIEDKLSGVDAKLNSVDTKLEDIEQSKQNMISTANQKMGEVDNKLQSVDSQVSEKLNSVDLAINDATSLVNNKLLEVDDKLAEIDNIGAGLEPIRGTLENHETRLVSVEDKNTSQDAIIEGLLNTKKDNMISIIKEGNSAVLSGCTEGKVKINRIKGNSINNLWNYNELELTGGARVSNGWMFFTTNSQEYCNFFMTDKTGFKPNTQYTLLAEVITNEISPEGWIFFTSSPKDSSNNSDVFTTINTRIKGGQTGKFLFNLTTKPDISTCNYGVRSFVHNVGALYGLPIKLRLAIIEGKYTLQDFPMEILSGNYATCEDTVVTQGMIDSGSEQAENLNKYKCTIKVTDGGGFSKTGSVYLSTPLKKEDELLTREDGVYHYHKVMPIQGKPDLPQYEKISNEGFIVDIVENSTIELVSKIPCNMLDVTYTSNVPSVYLLEEISKLNTLDIEFTQQAVDFLLMSTVGEGMKYNKSNGGNNMGAYFASRILKGALDYKEVVEKYPEFKEDIDFILKSEGREDLIKR